MKLNGGQTLALVICTLGVLTASSAQLTDLFGPHVTRHIVSSSNILMAVLSGWVAILFGQGNQVAAVRAMPGIEKLLVNAKASPTLAAMAMDPAESKIEATPAAQAAVAKTAKDAE